MGLATTDALAEAMSVLAHADPPAGGAETSDVIIATAMGLTAAAAVVAPIIAYRAGRMPALGRLADAIGRATGLPGWAALPLAIQGSSLIIAVFGMYWDISLHIDNGRDPGPLANPAHYFILVGLLGVMAAGVLAMALPRRETRSSLRIPGLGWTAPAGGILIAACGALSLSAFPLDDLWHRIFGQDVTLWSPTHLMLITGASLSTIGGLALYREALEETPEPIAAPARAGWLLAPLAGAMLIGLNTFIAEFDFGVPQFRLDFHPIGLMFASGLALVSARLVIGPWGAIATVGFFIVIRGALTVIVGPILGHTEPHLPLYVAEAMAVELVAVTLGRRGRSPAGSPVIFGAIAGATIGTIGLAAEWGWSHVWMVNPWPASMFPQGGILGFLMAVSAGVIGGFLGRALTLRGTRVAPAPGWVLPVAGIVAVGVVLFALPISSGDGKTSATLRVTAVKAPPSREVEGTLRLDPPDAAEDARWFQVTAWQGKEKSIVASLDERRPGVYRTTEAIPVYGTWKAILRLHVGDQVLGLPIFLPRDTGIPAPEVPTPPEFTRKFQLDKKNLQREQKEGVSKTLTTASYLGVLALTVGLTGCIVWGLRRIRIRLGSGEGPVHRST
jgi:hypothetical protein